MIKSTRRFQCFSYRTLLCGLHERLEIEGVSKVCLTHRLLGFAYVVRATLLSVTGCVAHRLSPVAPLLDLDSLALRAATSRIVAVNGAVCIVVTI